MKINFLDLKVQYLSLKNEIDDAIQEVIENTDFIGGKAVSRFTRSFEKIYGVEHCVPCGNGTDALFIALKKLGIGPGDEVITTASSWISTSETISLTGATPVFVDIDDYYTLDIQDVRRKISPKTKAIIPVHLYGQMADMISINHIATEYNLKVIEDCAQSHMSELNGTRAGKWGNCGTFSFYPGKNLGAYGDAGCIITSDSNLALDMKRYANHGSLVKHEHIEEGINSRLDGIQAAVLDVKLRYLEKWTQSRIEVAQWYFEELDSVERLELPRIRPNSKHSFHVFGIKTDYRDKLKLYLESKGIPTLIHYPKAMPFMKAYEYLGAKHEDYPKASDLQKRELSLPIYPELSKREVSYICQVIRDFFEKY